MTLHWPRLHILLGCSLLLAVTACSTPPIVEKKAAGKLPGPGTYAWQDPVADAGDFSGNPVAQMSAAAAADIRQAIDATLQQRGYRQRPPGEAAWRVSYQAKTETRTEDIAPDDKMLMPRMVCGLHDCNIVQEWQAFGPPQYAETQRSYRESTLRIELHDARSGEVVWRGSVSRDWVGRDAAKIAAAIGLQVPEQTRLLLLETAADHPFAITEMMMPVLPMVRVANVDQAIALAVKLEGGCHHTAAMHSRNLDHLDRMANAMDTSIFVKNGPCLAGLGFGGEGWTTMTITTPTGEGVTSARTFVRLRRCVMVDHLRIV